MQRARSVLAQRAQVMRAAIALVRMPAIMRMRLGMRDHDRVAAVLGDDESPDPDDDPEEQEGKVVYLTPRLDLTGLADEFEEVGRRLRMVS